MIDEFTELIRLFCMSNPSTVPSPDQTPARLAFYERISQKHLTPLWLSLANLVTPEPVSGCQPAAWSFADIRAAMIEAGSLITAKEAERRVLILENPGLRGQSKITTDLYAGVQPRPNAGRLGLRRRLAAARHLRRAELEGDCARSHGRSGPVFFLGPSGAGSPASLSRGAPGTALKIRIVGGGPAGLFFAFRGRVRTISSSGDRRMNQLLDMRRRDFQLAAREQRRRPDRRLDRWDRHDRLRHPHQRA